MNEKIFKGFIPTKGKRPIESIKGRTSFYPLDEVEHLQSYGGILKDDVISQFKNTDIILEFRGSLNPMQIKTDKCLDFLLPVRRRA